MAKNGSKQQTATAIEKPASALALMGGDELAGILGDEDLGVTGLEETDASDRRIAALVFNFEGEDAHGNPVSKGMLFDTVTEEAKPEARLVLLTLHKSNAWTEFVSGQGTKIRCRSWDRVAGEMEDGRTRPCEGCPDKAWRTDEAGKRGRRCSDVVNVVGLDLDDGQPKVMRFKRTSHRPWKDYLNKHFLGRRIVNGQRKNLPLFVAPTTVRLEMIRGASGSYAVPTFERGLFFSGAEIRYFAEAAKGAREWLDDVRRVADAAEERSADDAPANGNGGQVVDAGDFADDDDAPPAAANGARF